jgi:hypothetical protein
MQHHIPGEPTYNLKVPDICVESTAAAEAAGFSEFDGEALTRPDRS